MAWMWTRGDHTVIDFWRCRNCGAPESMRDGGEFEAVEHVKATGHNVVVVHRSERHFHAAGFTGDADKPVGHAHQ